MRQVAFLCLLAGGCAIAFAPILVRLSDTGPVASAFWRVALAAPLLWIWLAASSELEAASQAEVKAAASGSAGAQIKELARLRGIGLRSGRDLVNEVFYRSFNNGRQVGSFLGTVNSPYNSGNSKRDQGISKAGNKRARALAIQLAWLWLKHQPQSELSRWFHRRVGELKGRIRRINIVALARKLMIALWRYVTTGVVPAGAVLGRGI